MENFLMNLRGVGLVAAMLLLVSATFYVIGGCWRIKVVMRVANGKRDFFDYVAWPVSCLVSPVAKKISAALTAREEGKFRSYFGFSPIHFSNNEDWAEEAVNITLQGLARRLQMVFNLQEILRKTGKDDEVEDFVVFAKSAFWKAHNIAMAYGTRNMLHKYTDYLPQK